MRSCRRIALGNDLPGRVRLTEGTDDVSFPVGGPIFEVGRIKRGFLVAVFREFRFKGGEMSARAAKAGTLARTNFPSNS